MDTEESREVKVEKFLNETLMQESALQSRIVVQMEFKEKVLVPPQKKATSTTVSSYCCHSTSVRAKEP